MQPRPLRDGVVDVLPRVERAGGILQDELHAATEALERAAAVGQRGASVAHLAAGRPDQPDESARQGALAASRFADQRQDLAGTRREVHPVHRPGRRSAAATRIGDLQVDGLEHGPVVRRTHELTRSSTCTHAASRPGPARPRFDVARRALGQRHRAPRLERAAGRRPSPGRAGLRQPGRCQPRGRVADRRERSGQRRGVRVARFAQQLAGRADLDQPAGVHHGEPFADVAEHGQIMADHDQADLRIAHQVGEQLEDLRLHDHVQRGGGLVGDDQIRPAGERHGDHDALPLAAGELVRIGVRPRRRHAHAVQQLRGAGAGLAAADLLVQQDRLADLLTDRAHRVQRAHRPLEHHRHLRPAHRPQPAPAEGEHILALEPDLAGDARRRRQQPQQAERDRRLARPGLACDAERLTGVEGEVDPRAPRARRCRRSDR